MSGETDGDQTAMTANESVIGDDDLTIASIVESNGQMDYVAEVYRDHDKASVPEKQDYEFGQPVYVTTTVRGEERALVGVVYESRLVNPDQGRDGPRLSTPDQELFVPGYVDEKQTLLGIALLGFAELAPADGGQGFASVSQELPRWTLDIDDPVSKLSGAGFRRFHQPDGQLALRYYDRLITAAERFGAEVTLSLIERLRVETDREAMLDVIERKVRWEASTDRGVVR
ncbi:hypothetical protein MUK72_09925 [Halococcus dombrowskii]|uniref:DUF8166 domain-containing protein n=2 Tax=Halococcus dombrowskii TaxID=179637 RepID=A0AAX3AMR4_HALDO|nr:hypothetical protein [Halococcus dombrowskii]UOO94287.1 hypothetical protein MUK72_09925 [Halococcus dombrowskii]